jgi:predicted Zn-dependent peptidase
MSDIKNWSIDDIKDFHSTYYQPKNAIIVVAGDIDKEEVFNSSIKYFENIKNKKEIPSKIHTVEPKQDGAKKVTILKDSAVEMLAITYHIPNFEHKDQVALSALSEFFSSGKSSILQKRLVDEKRLVNSVYAYNLELKDPGLFMFMAVANEGVKAKDIEKEILAIIDEVKKGKISKKDLDKIKINSKADFIFSLESSSSVASLYGTYFVRDNVKPLFDYEKKVEALNKKDLIKAANKYFTKNNSTTVILKQEKK